MCPKHGVGHKHKVSAWKSHQKYDPCNTINFERIFRRARETLVKLPLGAWRHQAISWTNVDLTSVNAQCITVTSQWTRWRLKSPASRLFIQPFIQTQIKENIKAPPHWPLCGEFTGTGYAENVSIWWRHHGHPVDDNFTRDPQPPVTKFSLYTLL